MCMDPRAKATHAYTHIHTHQDADAQIMDEQVTDMRTSLFKLRNELDALVKEAEDRLLEGVQEMRHDMEQFTKAQEDALHGDSVCA